MTPLGIEPATFRLVAYCDGHVSGDRDVRGVPRTVWCLSIPTVLLKSGFLSTACNLKFTVTFRARSVKTKFHQCVMIVKEAAS
jgi:hypothetical protein